MKQADEFKTMQAIHTLAASRDDYVTWQEIMEAVSAVVPVKNWMPVRGVLQFLLNQGALVRDPNVHVERYRLVTGK